MLKARRLGYDGYGNATCADEEEAREAFARLDAGDGVLVEGLVPFERELAAMVARSPAGAEAAYPVVETVQAQPRLPRGRGAGAGRRRRRRARRRGRPGRRRRGARAWA